MVILLQRRFLVFLPAAGRIMKQMQQLLQHSLPHLYNVFACIGINLCYGSTQLFE